MSPQAYRAQVELLLACIPHIAKEKVFALKGGTAINLFVRDFPRLSVDIDLTYLGNEARTEALAVVETALRRTQASIEASLSDAKIILSKRKTQETDIKLHDIQRAP